MFKIFSNICVGITAKGLTHHTTVRGGVRPFALFKGCVRAGRVQLFQSKRAATCRTRRVLLTISFFVDDFPLRTRVVTKRLCAIKLVIPIQCSFVRIFYTIVLSKVVKKFDE